MGLVYGQRLKKQLFYSLTSYMDSNFASDPKNQKLVMSYCFFLNRVIVFWYSKKQKTVLTSTTKAKYIVFDHAIREAVWI